MARRRLLQTREPFYMWFVFFVSDVGAVLSETRQQVGVSDTTKQKTGGGSMKSTKCCC